MPLQKETLQIIGGSSVAVIAVVCFSLIFYHIGKNHGHDAGYKEGYNLGLVNASPTVCPAIPSPTGCPAIPTPTSFNFSVDFPIVNTDDYLINSFTYYFTVTRTTYGNTTVDSLSLLQGSVASYNDLLNNDNTFKNDRYIDPAAADGFTISKNGTTSTFTKDSISAIFSQSSIISQLDGVGSPGLTPTTNNTIAINYKNKLKPIPTQGNYLRLGSIQSTPSPSLQNLLNQPFMTKYKNIRQLFEFNSCGLKIFVNLTIRGDGSLVIDNPYIVDVNGKNVSVDLLNNYCGWGSSYSVSNDNNKVILKKYVTTHGLYQGTVTLNSTQ